MNLKIFLVIFTATTKQKGKAMTRINSSLIATILHDVIHGESGELARCFTALRPKLESGSISEGNYLTTEIFGTTYSDEIILLHGGNTYKPSAQIYENLDSAIRDYEERQADFITRNYYLETVGAGVTAREIINGGTDEKVLDSIFRTRTAPEIAALIDASNRRILGDIYGQQATQNVADFLTELGAVE